MIPLRPSGFAGQARTSHYVRARRREQRLERAIGLAESVIGGIGVVAIVAAWLWVLSFPLLWVVAHGTAVLMRGLAP